MMTLGLKSLWENEMDTGSIKKVENDDSALWGEIRSIIAIQLAPEHWLRFQERLGSRCQELGVSLAEYIEFLKTNRETETALVLSLLTPAHTFFFREFLHFEFLAREGFEKILSSKKERKLRILSAPCSDGQEVYSLAMFLKYHFKENDTELDWRILGCDINADCVSKARNGVYLREELKGVPPIYIQGAWIHGVASATRFVSADSSVRSRVEFFTDNILNPSQIILQEPFDIIFCRNMLIYYDRKESESICQNLLKLLRPDGLLFVGVSESIHAMGLELNYLGRSIYQKKAKASVSDTSVEVIGIGASTGGTEALKQIVAGLANNLPPIVIVQHMRVNFVGEFANSLARVSTIPVKVAVDGDLLRRGHIYLAPDGKQMGVVRVANQLTITLKNEPAMSRHRPSVDYLFSSLSTDVGKDTMGVLLTGMGSDGAQGLKLMRDVGACTLVQDEKSCTVFGMPKVAIELGAAEKVVALNAIANAIEKMTKCRPAANGVSKK